MRDEGLIKNSLSLLRRESSNGHVNICHFKMREERTKIFKI